MRTKQALTSCLSTFVLTVCIAGCTDENSGPPEHYVGDNAGGDYDECAETASEAVDWDAVGELGVSPADAFSGLSEPCTSTLNWDAGIFDLHEITPVSGESEVTVTVSVDPATVRLTRSVDPACDRVYLEVDGTVHVKTADGTFDDTGAVTITYAAEWGVSDFAFSKSVDALGGALSIPLAANETGEIGYSFSGAMTSCAGNIEMWTERPEGNGTSSGGVGAIGSWSNTGCPLGTEPVAIQEAEGDGVSIYDQVTAIWSDNTFSAVWDDGEATTLEMQVELTETDGCIELPGQALLDAEVRYLTADGRLAERTVQADLEIAFGDDGAFRSSTVNINDERICADESDDLGYTLNSCAALESILIQLRIERRSDGTMSVADEGGMIYEYDRNSTASPGAADRVRSLAITL